MEEANPLDWIGMYILGESNPFNYLDFKSHGITGRYNGHLEWSVDPQIFRNVPQSMRRELKVCFKYYSGVTGTLRAVSPSVAIILPSRKRRITRQPSISEDQTNNSGFANSTTVSGKEFTEIDFSIKEIRCNNLRRAMLFEPNFFVKTRLSDNRQTMFKTKSYSGSVCPSWSHLTFNFRTSLTNSLIFMVKDKPISGISRVIGHGVLPVSVLMRKLQYNGRKEFSMEINLISKHSNAEPRTYMVVTFEIHELKDKNEEWQNIEDVLNNSYFSSAAAASDPFPSIMERLPILSPISSGSEPLTVVDATSPFSELPWQEQEISPTVATHNSDSGVSTCSGANAVNDEETCENKDQNGMEEHDVEREPIEPASLPGTSTLPPAFESRVDEYGRIFYIDHLTRSTSWTLPKLQEPMFKETDAVRRKQVEKRYKYMRRTVGSAIDSRLGRDTSRFPAVDFLSRPDFMSFIHRDKKARDLYNESQYLKHIIHRIRADPAKYERFQHNTDLIALLQLFADTSQDLPLGWEIRLDHEQREFFVDHRNKCTTFIDPRLPTTVRRRRARSVPSDRADYQLSYNEQVVIFIRQAGVIHRILSETQANMRNNNATPASLLALRDKLNNINRFGLSALYKCTRDVDLIAALSMFEEEISSIGASSIPEKHRDEEDVCFDIKLAQFQKDLCDRGFGFGPQKLKIVIKRDDLLRSAFESIISAPKSELRMSKLLIAFNEEDGLDYGGPSREFFFLLSRELFNPYYGLFEYSAHDTYTVLISPLSVFVDNFVEWFYFCGRVLGLAIIHRYLLDVFFVRAFYRILLRRRFSLQDLESIDPQFYASLTWLQANKVTPDLQLTFCVSEDVGGQVVERELKPHGRNVLVTEANKADYIECVAKWRMERGILQQTDALLKGFEEIVDETLVNRFDARELELVISGTLEIDIADWRSHTEYKSGYSDTHIVIEWFWETVEKFKNSQRLQLLQFVTGSSSVPYEGFSALRGSNGPKKFTIERWGEVNDLPRAHTCFNRLDLPPYTSYNMLYDKLLLAIEESLVYGIE